MNIVKRKIESLVTSISYTERFLEPVCRYFDEMFDLFFFVAFLCTMAFALMAAIRHVFNRFSEKGGLLSPENYRPTSSTCTTCKPLEYKVSDVIGEYLT